MKNSLKLQLLTAFASVALVAPASAGFINGGFETGDFTGWTVEHAVGDAAFSTSGTSGHAFVIGPTVDPYSPFDNPFNGNFMARLNSTTPNADHTRISQTATMLAGETAVFVNWGAVLNDPGHAPQDQPFFSIEVYKNSVLFGSVFKIAGGTDWTASSAGYRYNSGQFNVTGLLAGDTVSIVMTVADCDLGGHAGYAYLDGIGTVAEAPPPSGVPDGGSSIALLGLAMSAVAGVRRRIGS